MDDLKESKLPTNCVLASFDIESLFTNIPVKETTDIATNLAFPSDADTSYYRGFSKKRFKKLLTLCTQDTYFIFNKSYHQIEGMAMGNPLGPVFADILLSHYEVIWLNDCPPEFKPIFYRRYVDDTFLAFKTKDHIQQFHNYVNVKHHSLKFTYDIENNDSLPFIGVLVTKSDCSYQTRIYHKPTSTDLFTNFVTFAPKSHKLAAIRSLCYRTIHICSSYQSIDEEFGHLTKQFTRNGYPTNVLNKIMSMPFKRAYEQDFMRKSSSQIKERSLLFYTKFYGNASLYLSKQIKKLCHRYFKLTPNTITFAYSTFKTKNIFSYKDKLPDVLRASVVYKFQCGGCNSIYVGQTGRHLRTRASEHLGKSSSTGLPIMTNSTVFDHICKTGHQADMTCFSVLCSTGNKFDLPAMEQLQIRRLKPDMNRQTDFTFLHLI